MVKVEYYISLPAFWKSEDRTMLFIRWFNLVTDYSCYNFFMYGLKWEVSQILEETNVGCEFGGCAVKWITASSQVGSCNC